MRHLISHRKFNRVENIEREKNISQTHRHHSASLRRFRSFTHILLRHIRIVKRKVRYAGKNIDRIGNEFERGRKSRSSVDFNLFLESSELYAAT